jgi:hypothetical protein
MIKNILLSLSLTLCITNNAQSSYANTNESLSIIEISQAIKQRKDVSSYQYFLLADDLINEKSGEYNPRKAFSLLYDSVYNFNDPYPESIIMLAKMFQYWKTWNFYESTIEDYFNYIVRGEHSEFYNRNAFNLMHRAASLEQPEAFGNMGEMYIEGIGTRRDLLKAFVWFYIGSHYKDHLSLYYLNHINDYLLPKEIEFVKEDFSEFLKTKNFPSK